MTKLELIDKIKDCNITLEGGNDEGFINVENIEDSEISNYIEDKLYYLCDYGSFAGNYSVTGEGYYDENNKKIILNIDEEDYKNYTTVETINFQTDIIENVFDSFNILINYNNDEMSELEFRLNIKNGIWKKEYDTIIDNIKENIEDTINELDKNFNSIFIDKNKTLINKNKIEFDIDLNVNDHFNKTVSIELDEILEHFNNNNNE